MNAGERIKELRKGLNFTQQQLADKVRVTYIQIGRYETDKPPLALVCNECLFNAS